MRERAVPAESTVHPEHQTKGEQVPTCIRCGITQATVEMRRSPKKGDDGAPLYLCKDQAACQQRRGARRANRIAKGEPA